MPNCPFCKADLSQADLGTGKCSTCSRELISGEAQQHEAAGRDSQSPLGAATPPADQRTAHARGEETLTADALPLEPPKERQTAPAPEPPIAKTLDADAGQATLPGGEPPRGAADGCGGAQTLETGAATVPSAGGGPATRDSRGYAKTCDGTEASFGDIAERVSMVWAGKLPSEATPRTSLKVDALASEAQPNLVIQARVLRDVKAGGPGRADYEVLGKLGAGGMGVVMAARQASIDRTVAVKMLKPAAASNPDSRRKFLAEAVVTGDLEHPNIVPIYDLGKDEAGALFYSMKRVKGTPWDTVLGKKTCQENLEVWMKIADAVAFAHSRGVVHRDLKPENVMLGDYGEVLLMDWGLAMIVGNDNTRAGMSGTPAYMAPEMASGPIDQIGFPSDIYLLGAILYEIVTGHPPHAGKNAMDCLFAAARNEIRPTEKSGELLSIAMRAMAAQPEGRYATVAELQDALRQYRSHSESISLSVRADEELQDARQRDEYEAYARAVFGFQEALALWDGNTRAAAGLSEACLAYAQSALVKGDYDLGASLLDRGNPQHLQVLEEIQAAQRDRDARQQRLRWAVRIGAGLVVTVLVVVIGASLLIRAEAKAARDAEEVAKNERKTAVAEKERADTKAEEARKDRTEAVKQRDIAKTQKEIADRQRTEAVTQKNLADQQRALAKAAEKKEAYEAYVARIGLAAVKIEENAFDKAMALLQQCPAELRDWEWGRLMYLCTQEIRTFNTRQPVEAVAFSADGKRFVTGGWGGTARIWEAESGKELQAISAGGQFVFAVAFSPDGRHVVTGGNDAPDYLKIWDAATGRLLRGLRGHRDAVLSVAYSRDGRRLLTSSYDCTARLWDLETNTSQVFQGHQWWVWSAAFSPDETQIVTACQDGSAIVWSVATGKAGPPFLGHLGPVYAAVFSPDGKQVATGGYDNRILLWEPGKVKPFDFDLDSPTGSEKKPPPACEALEGHTAGVRSLQFSANGSLLLSGGSDNTLRVWDVATRKPVKTLRGHGGRVQACVFAPDGQRLLSGSHDHLAKIWSLAGCQEARVFTGRVLSGHRDVILGADFSPDGRQVVSASRDGTAKTWDSATGKEIRQFREGHEFLATAAIFLPDRKRILTAAVDNTARIWDMATGTELQALTGTGPSAAVAVSSDGRRILTGSDDQTAKLWNAESGQLERRLEGHRCEISAVAISPDGKWFYTGDVRGEGRLWDAQSGQVKCELTGHARGVAAAFFLPDSQRLLTASTDNTVTPWDVPTGREDPARILKHPDAVTSMALSPDGRRLLTTCADCIVRLWDVSSAKEIGRLAVAGEVLHAAVFSPDGRRAATTGPGGVRLWDLQTLREADDGRRGPFLTAKATGGQAWSAAFAPDGARLLTVGGNDARLWEIHSARKVMQFHPHGSVASARFSPDGKRIITGSWDATARIWNAQTGLAEMKLEGAHTQYVNDAAFSPVDSTKALTASDDGTARLWDLKTGKVLVTFAGHQQRIRTAVFDRDGKRVLTASNDKTARIWDAATGRILAVLKGHQQAVLCAAFSRDGTRVITGGEDKQASLWEADSGKRLPFSLEGHTAEITSVAFAPDGHRAITASQDTTAKIWDAQTGKEILTLKGHLHEVTAAGFSPNGRSVLTGSRDGTLILWLTTDWRPGHTEKIAGPATPPDKSPR